MKLVWMYIICDSNVVLYLQKNDEIVAFMIRYNNVVFWIIHFLNTKKSVFVCLMVLASFIVCARFKVVQNRFGISLKSSVPNSIYLTENRGIYFEHAYFYIWTYYLNILKHRNLNIDQSASNFMRGGEGISHRWSSQCMW